jgi:hypothetical protein
MRDFTKPVAIMVTGTGPVDKRNLRAELDDWVFGPVDAADSVESREVTIIFPIMDKPSPGMRFMVDWAIDVDADVQVFQTKGKPMTKELSGLPDIEVSDNERETLEKAFSRLLELEKDGHETVFLMHYNEDSIYTQGDSSMSDLEILCEAKNYTWLKTLNSEVMGDTFPNYESTDDRIKREKLEAEFAKKEAEEKAAAKPAKKAAAPRKTAAKKTVAKKPTEPVKEPEKPLAGLDKLISDAVAKDPAHKHKFVWFDDENGKDGSFCEHCGMDERDFWSAAELIKHSTVDRLSPEQRKTVVDMGVMTQAEVDEEIKLVETKLKATVALERPMPKSLGAAKGMPENLSVVSSEDIWADVAKNAPKAVESTRNELVMQLGEDIAAMGDAFSRTIRTYAALVEDIRNG